MLFEPYLSVPFNGSKYIHTVIQPAQPFIPELFKDLRVISLTIIFRHQVLAAAAAAK